MRAARFLTAAFAALLALAAPAAGKAAPSGLVRIEAGSVEPFATGAGEATAIPVAAFRMEAYPVTNAEYLDFVRARPEWRRSQVSRLFAAEGYLAHWAGDLELGPEVAALSASPVTNVSWFAARAYARWRGLRLPSLAEWEYAASAGFSGEAMAQRILAWYGRPTRIPLPPVGSTAANAWGVWDLHGLVWEWVEDFNSALVTGESRAGGDLEQDLFCAGGAASAADRRNYAAFMRTAFRSSLAGRDCVAALGFRCAGDLQPAPAIAKGE